MPVYLDYNATAPVRPEVVQKMQEILAFPANASSAHRYGREAKKHLEQARKTIAGAISAFPAEIIFTASGTEANITALGGFAGRKLLVSAIEHSSVLSSLRGGKVTEAIQRQEDRTASPAARNDVIPVLPSGVVDRDALERMLADGKPTLVSVMLANNETGVIQPIREVAAICKTHGALLHCDAVQALGKIPLDFGLLGCDLMTISAHKCGGPVGAAALVVKQNLPIAPLLTGGGQELGRRAGTENIAAIAGFAVAVERFDFSHMKKLEGWLGEMENTIQFVSPLEGAASAKATAGLEHARLSEAERRREGDAHSGLPMDHPPPNPPPRGGRAIIGARAPRLPNTSCIIMPGVLSEVQLMNFDLAGFAISAGSACSSGRIEPSHVLKAMGVEAALAQCAIRISGGWNTSQKDIQDFAAAWSSLSTRLSSGVSGVRCETAGSGLEPF